MPRPVLTKRDFVRRYKLGEFGNAAPTWDSIGEWLDSGYSGRVHIRSREAGDRTFYNVLGPVHAQDCADQLEDYYVSAMAPHGKGLIQGEVQRSNNGLELYWTSAHLPMREAFAKYGGVADTGLTAKLLLQKVMDPMSYEWLEYLLEAYPDHVVEFSSFGVNWGTIPNRNTVIWEVRKY